MSDPTATDSAELKRPGVSTAPVEDSNVFEQSRQHLQGRDYTFSSETVEAWMRHGRLSPPREDMEVGKTIIKTSTQTSMESTVKEPVRVPRRVGWIRAAFTMFKTQVGIGVLSIPIAFNRLGLIPGLLCLCIVNLIGNWVGYQIGQVALRYPEIQGIHDVGRKIAGRFGRELFASAYDIYWIFVGASAIVSISICFNAILAEVRICTNILMFIATAGAWKLSSIRNIGEIGGLSIFGAASILVSLMTLTIAIPVQGRPADAPQTGPWSSDYQLFGDADLVGTMTAVSAIIFAYSGIPAYFTVLLEMKEPKHYNRAMFSSLAAVFTTYAVIGTTVYVCCGSFVSSPALGSAGGVMTKVCYGIALPGLWVSACLVCHYPIKHIYVRLSGVIESRAAANPISPATSSTELSPTPTSSPAQTKKQTRTDFLLWHACALSVNIVAYIIASAAPSFEELVALVGAALGTLICFHPFAGLWLRDNGPWKKSAGERSARFWASFVWCCFVLVAGTFCWVAGTYAAAVSMREAGEGRKPWSCEDNAFSARKGVASP